MSFNSRSLKTHKRVFVIALIFIWALYAALTLFTPDHQAISRYGLTPTQISLLRATILVPYLFIWLTSLYAVLYFRDYRKMLNGAIEGKAFKDFSFGITLLLAVIVLPPFINLISGYFPGSPLTTKYVTISSNYLTLLLYLFAFIRIYRGAILLTEQIKVDPAYIKKVRATTMTVLAAFVCVYVWLVFHNPVRTESTDPLVRSTYFLPDWLIVLTILVPYVATWFCGSLAAVHLLTYSRNVSGILYRKAFRYVGYGFFTTIVLSISLQFLNQTGAFLGHSTIKLIIGLIYLIFLLLAVSYLLIARGGKKLTDIEEI